MDVQCVITQCSLVCCTDFLCSCALLYSLNSQMLVYYCQQVIHGLLDRVMQVLDVPCNNGANGYSIKAVDGTSLQVHTHTVLW